MCIGIGYESVLSNLGLEHIVKYMETFTNSGINLLWWESKRWGFVEIDVFFCCWTNSCFNVSEVWSLLYNQDKEQWILEHFSCLKPWNTKFLFCLQIVTPHFFVNLCLMVLFIGYSCTFVCLLLLLSLSNSIQNTNK